MAKCSEVFQALARQINGLFGNKEPWQVASITAISLMTTLWFLEQIRQDESKEKSINREKKRIEKLISFNFLIQVLRHAQRRSSLN